VARNVARHGAKPAYREKELGIWQVWTWAEAAEEMEALALGFLTLGASPGDHIAIVGRNRPQLYWAMVAAQMAGAVPVPLYQDAAAEEVGYALDHSGARFVVCGDQEQVDKVIETGVHMDHLVYLDPRGLRKYDHGAMTPYTDLQARGRAEGDRAAARALAMTTPA